MRQKNGSAKNRKAGNAALLLAAFIWGIAFVAQSVGMQYIGPFTFQWIRNLIGAAALLPVIVCRDKNRHGQGKEKRSSSKERKLLLLGGFCCGIALFTAGSFQQIGIQYTTVGNAGFLTSIYLVLVPVLGVFLHQRVKAKNWFCVALAVVGMYFLSISGKLSISKGDVLVIVSAFFFAVQILVVDYFAPKADPVRLSCIQFLVTGVLSMFPALLLEAPDWDRIVPALSSLLYTGILSSGVAYTLQMVAQRYVEPTAATLFMSLESVFSMLGGIVVLRQIPTRREFAGACLVFLAVILSQVDLFGKEKQGNGRQQLLTSQKPGATIIGLGTNRKTDR